MSLAINPTILEMRNVLSKFGQGAFFAHHAAAVTVNTATTLALTTDTEIIDVCSWFAGNTFTPKQPGSYLLWGSAYVTEDADFTDGTTVLSLFIRKGGATPAYIAKTSKKATQLTTVVMLEANGTTDAFDLAASHTAGGGVDVSDISFGGVFVSYNNP